LSYLSVGLEIVKSFFIPGRYSKTSANRPSLVPKKIGSLGKWSFVAIYLIIHTNQNKFQFNQLTFIKINKNNTFAHISLLKRKIFTVIYYFLEKSCPMFVWLTSFFIYYCLFHSTFSWIKKVQ
jgi:hypothetical protein